KSLIDFGSHQERRLSSLEAQLRQQQDGKISKINLLWKAVSEKLDDTPTRNTNKIEMHHPQNMSIFVNSIIILNKEDEAKESAKSSATEYKDHEMTAKRKEEFEDETDEETEEEEEDNPEHFDFFPTMKELGYH
nr:hypothetical protein [Tanacetum cinerariifolium]